MKPNHLQPETISPLKRALLALEKMQKRLEELETKRKEPIAVVGMGCRLPGAADDPHSYWHVLRSGMDTVSDIPAQRWDVDYYYDPSPGSPGKMYARRGSFLQTVDTFDAGFFGISPREAVLMDPQQRLLLEVGWEALENAALVPDKLSGRMVGVYMGVMTDDYLRLCLKARDPELLGAHFVTGNSMSFAAGRLSYFLGVHGPSITIDTACSSSLVSVHLACQGLRSGDCDLALAGGVNLILSPELFITLSQFRAISADGRCKTFDAAADGFGRGEGCGVVVLKRLADALADGDRVDALILGSAVNHDGPSAGLTVPNGLAQQALLRRALADAGVLPARVGFVEAHGTGTSLGDPIEVRALSAVYGEGRLPSERLRIGSAKAAIGHLDSAAGIAGLIKVILSLNHEEIPAQPNFRQINPHIAFDDLPLEIPTRAIAWPAGALPRVAGVSAFGLSGTNAHVIIGEAPAAEPVPSPASERSANLLCLSAKTGQALKELAGRYATYMRRNDAAALADIAFTAHTGRFHWNRRLAVVGGSARAVVERLDAFAAGRHADGVCSGHGDARKPPRVAFVFTGQGAQMPGMGRQLYETQPLFRRLLDDCDRMLRHHLEKPLLSVIFPRTGDADLIHQTHYTQPALFAFEYALAGVWRSWGIEPMACMGHSVGEYVAACVAGVFSLEDGLRLVAERGRLIHQLPLDGAMVALSAEEERVSELLLPYTEFVSIAAVNGPRQTVISGRRDVLQRLVADLESAGIRGTPLKVSHAFHSPLMEPILDRLYEKASQVNFASPRIDVISNLTGREAIPVELCNPAYWRRQIRQPVMFFSGVQSLDRLGADVVIEIGPKPTLTALARDCHTREMTWLPSLQEGRDDWQQMLESLSALYVRGTAVDWPGFYRGESKRRVALPSYPFQRERHWIPAPEKRPQAADVPPFPREDRNRMAVPAASQRQEMPIMDPPQLMMNPAGQAIDREEAASEIPEDHWYYETIWEPQDPRLEATPPRRASAGTWLILSNRAGEGAQLAQRIEACGERSILARGGQRFEHLGAREWSLRFAEAGDYERILERAAADDRFPLRGVIYLGALDLATPETLTSRGLLDGQQKCCGGFLHLVHALTRRAPSVPDRLRLVVVTRGARAVDAEAEMSGFCGSSLWGASQVVALEHPELECLGVDLDPVGSGDSILNLAEEVCSGQHEDQVAFRNGRRYVARLARKPPPARRTEAPLLFRPDGTYWVTGGLSGLGLQVVRWMVSGGVRHLVITARSAGSDKARQVLAGLQRPGLKIVAVAADVAHEEQLGRVFKEFRHSMPPLRGVVHSAGLLDDGALFQLNWERFEKVIAPKIGGAWNLHRLTTKAPLDFFVLFSSSASVLGAAGQANYAAANALMDGLAHYRRTQGRPAISVNWGPWSEVGMAAMASPRDQQGLRRRGMGFIAPVQGLRSLESLLQANDVQTAVLPMDWRKYRRYYPRASASAFLSRVTGAIEASSSGRRDRAQPVVLHGAENSPTSRHAAGEARLITHIAAVMQLNGDRIDRDRPLTEIGLDSIMALELENRIESEWRIAIPMTDFLEGISTNRLISLVMTRLAESEKGLPAPAGEISAGRLEGPGHAGSSSLQGAAGFPGQVDQLSDTEVDNLLRMMLSREKPLP